MTIEEELHPAQFFLNRPLYAEMNVDVSLNLHTSYVKESNKEIRFDGYEIYDKKETTFIWKGAQPAWSSHGGVRYHRHDVICTRTGRMYTFWIRFDPATGSLMKVGQFPSLADLHTHEVKSYDKLLTKDVRAEFVKAIGLAAHGVGIGSFVYLRRIFESLIISTYEAHDVGVPPAEFKMLRMEEKIGLLRGHLPSFLVENSMMYGMLSSGIHELSEEQCLNHFDLLRTGIEIILDQQLEEKNRLDRLNKAAALIRKASNDLKKV